MERFLNTLTRRQAIITIILLACAVYGYFALTNDFVTFDDGILITKNPAVQQLTLPAIWHFFTSYDPELYVPLTMLSLQITYAIFGLSAWAFHLGNLALHVGSAIFVFLISEKLTGSRQKSLLIGLLFALHPLNTEAVLWAAARKDVLSAAFFLSAFWSYIVFREKERKGFLVLSSVLFALGLFCKVSIIALPILLLLLDLWDGKGIKKSLSVLWSFFGLAVIFGLIAIRGKQGVLESSSGMETIILSIRSAEFYLWKLVYAWNFSVIYPALRPVTINLPTIVSFLVLVLLAIAAWIYRKKQPLITFGILWYVLLLLPNSTNFLKNGFLFAASDRYAYLALVGIFIALVELLSSFLTQEKWKKIAVYVSTLLIILCGGLTVAQARTWASSESLYRNVLRLYPDSVIAMNNLGVLLNLEDGRQAEAEAIFKRVLEVDPYMPAAAVNLGEIERKRGNAAKAEAYFRQGITAVEKKKAGFLGLDDMGAYYYLSDLLDQTGRRDEAIAVLQDAISRAPKLGEPHHNLGLLLQKMGRIPEAMAEYQKAVDVESTYIPARYMLAGLLAERGKLPEAAEQLRAIVALSPHYEKAASHLADIEKLLAQ